jgi:hypothetical protein
MPWEQQAPGCVAVGLAAIQRIITSASRPTSYRHDDNIDFDRFPGFNSHRTSPLAWPPDYLTGLLFTLLPDTCLLIYLFTFFSISLFRRQAQCQVSYLQLTNGAF